MCLWPKVYSPAVLQVVTVELMMMAVITGEIERESITILRLLHVDCRFEIF